MAIGGGTKKALKSTKTARKIGSTLSDTGAVKALRKVSDGKDAVKARATARVLLATDDASGSMIRQADSAGQAVRLWRLQRQMDADADALSDAKQQRLAATLARGHGDATRAIRQMDQDTLADLTEPAVDPAVRARLAPTYAELDASKRAELSRAIDGDRDAAVDAANLDSDGVRDALAFYCVGGSVANVGGVGLGSDVAYSVAAGDDCPSVQTDFGSELWKIDSDLRDGLNRETLVALQRNGLGTEGARYLQRSGDVGGQRLLNQFASADDARLPAFLEFRVNTGGYRVAGSIRRTITKKRYNYAPFSRIDTVEETAHGTTIRTTVKGENGGEIGVNGRIYEDGESNVRSQLQNNEGQMSENWIENKFQDMYNGKINNKEQKEFLRILADDNGIDAFEVSDGDDSLKVNDINKENVNSELLAYQDDSPTGDLASKSLRQQNTNSEPTIDTVEVVKIGDVFGIQ